MSVLLGFSEPVQAVLLKYFFLRACLKIGSGAVLWQWLYGEARRRRKPIVGL
jgi:hypothetical protein